MASIQSLAPTREDFTALLNETYGDDEAFEGTVVKGKIVAIEKDMAVIDVGLKTEGRGAVKEFTNHDRDPGSKAKSISSGSRTRSAKRSFPATRPDARRAGSSSSRPSRRTRRSRGS